MKPLTVEKWDAFRKSDGSSWRWQMVAFLVACVLVFSRRPDVLLNAQFYAEDGAVWFAQAYNLGWLHSLNIPAGGYLNTLQRLVAGVALLLPFGDAPLVMNLFGIALQALPAWFLLTSRCRAWGPLPVRILQALIYLAIPNSREVHVVLTNAQFHLALLTFLVAFAAPPLNWRWRIFDIAILVINGLSGPFGIVLLPLVLVFYGVRRYGWSLVVAAVMVPTVCLQLMELFQGGLALRAAGGQLGATPLLLARILAGQVYLAAFLGENSFAVTGDTIRVVLVALMGTAILLYCLLKSTLELRLFILFSMALLAASLSRPLVASATPMWVVLTTIQSMRYWFFPMLALLWCFLWFASRDSERFQMFGFLALLSATIGVHKDWRYPPYKDENFHRYVAQFEAAPAGTVIRIPIFPDGVIVELNKKNR